MIKHNKLLVIGIFCLTLSACSNNHDKKLEIGTANEKFCNAIGLPKTILKLSLNKIETRPVIQNNNMYVPEGMVLVPGGIVRIGSNEGFEQEQPMFWAQIDDFYMDKNLVSVADFRKFIEATKYKTEAEKFGNSGVIDDFTGKKWDLVAGANWEYPRGPKFEKAKDDHPVTQISWNDAQAYATWAHKRLPCEMEWEHAARNAKNTSYLYPWGNDIKVEGKWKANVWQGKFPEENFVEDGFAYTSPIGFFGTNKIGLGDMSGNVWQWMLNPKFNYLNLFTNTFDSTAISKEMALRGGSFLCEPGWCHGYRVSGRSQSSKDTGLFHVGFRCVKDIR